MLLSNQHSKRAAALDLIFYVTCFLVSYQQLKRMSFNMAAKKSKALKKLAGTFQKAKEKKPRNEADIRQEIEEAKEAIEAMRVSLRLATQELAAKGLMVLTTVTDSNGRHAKVRRLNPAAKAQKDALKMQQSLRKQLSGLEAELESSNVGSDEDDELAQFD